MTRRRGDPPAHRPSGRGPGCGFASDRAIPPPSQAGVGFGLGSVSCSLLQPRKRNVFFVITFPPGIIYGGSFGIALNLTTRRHPRLGLVSGSSCDPTQIHIRGLCHWAGEPAGHLGAESPSRRTARPASARKTSSPCPHWLRGLSQTHHMNAVSRHRRVPPFASSRRRFTHALAHLQWQEPPRFIDASATSRASNKEPSPSRGPTTRPLQASPRHP